MTRIFEITCLACALGGAADAARCTTTLEPETLRAYESYVATVEKAMAARFDGAELSFIPVGQSPEAASRLAAGKVVRWSLADAALNQRLAPQNGTVLHWVGAVHIAGATLADLRAVLQDYEEYNRIYQPLIFQCRGRRRTEELADVFDLVFGLSNKFRFASIFPQSYAFQVKARVDYASANPPAVTDLRAHLRAEEIRESDSGVPDRNDLLQQYRDHGILWALNAYWRARQRATGLYLEFETITLARSTQAFVCRLGIIPVPKSVVSAVMDALPAETAETVLEGTRTECDRRVAARTARIHGQ